MWERPRPAIFASQVWETLLLSIFQFPNIGKRCFYHFCGFPKLGKPIFTVFEVSQHWDGLFLPFSAFPNVGTSRLYHFAGINTLRMDGRDHDHVLDYKPRPCHMDADQRGQRNKNKKGGSLISTNIQIYQTNRRHPLG